MTGTNPAALINRKTGDWWADERRNWCAYCGVAIANEAGKLPSATRDHVVPRAHKGRHVTIPCCRACNRQKADRGLPEFMLTAYFAGVRSEKRERQWPLRDLWLVVALAAVEQARGHGVVAAPA
jgi:5-methylcytosine-specific restriction endonuclease McrA